MSSRQIFKTKIDEVSAVARDPLGALRWENDKLYKYLKNVEAATCPVGHLTKYANAAGHSAHECTRSTSQDLAAAGVAAAAVPQNHFGWFQLKGAVNPAVNPTGSNTAGGSLSVSATTGALALWVTPRQILGTYISNDLVLLDIAP
jgi:hypothetical protein